MTTLILFYGGGLTREFVGFPVQTIFSAKSGKAFVSRRRFDVREPANLGRAFGAGVDRPPVGFAQGVSAAHQTLIFCAMPKREHMAGFVGGDL